MKINLKHQFSVSLIFNNLYLFLFVWVVTEGSIFLLLEACGCVIKHRQQEHSFIHSFAQLLLVPGGNMEARSDPSGCQEFTENMTCNDVCRRILACKIEPLICVVKIKVCATQKLKAVFQMYCLHTGLWVLASQQIMTMRPEMPTQSFHTRCNAE